MNSNIVMAEAKNHPLLFLEHAAQASLKPLPPIGQVLTEHLSQEDFTASSVTYYEVHTQPRAIHGDDVAIVPIPLFTL